MTYIEGRDYATTTAEQVEPSRRLDVREGQERIAAAVDRVQNLIGRLDDRLHDVMYAAYPRAVPVDKESKPEDASTLGAQAHMIAVNVEGAEDRLRDLLDRLAL